MQNKFDKTYETNKEMFGHPYSELQKYFNEYPIKGTVLDLGCGQGRDALFLASIGYSVTAIDSSKVGIDQMAKKAAEQNLKVKGIAADVLNFEPSEKFDIILFDMLLHSFEKEQQLKLLQKYTNSLSEKGIFCIVFPDDMKTNYFLNILKSLVSEWKLLDEITINDTPKDCEGSNDYTFIMITVQCIS